MAKIKLTVELDDDSSAPEILAPIAESVRLRDEDEDALGDVIFESGRSIGCWYANWVDAS